MWILYAFGSALFAGLTAVLAKCGIRKTDSTVATAIRTIVVLAFSWLMVFIVGSQERLSAISEKTLLFLILSGLATGASWLCYFRALQIGDINKVVPVDKSSTVLTILLAVVFLHESLSIAKGAGIVLIAAGVRIAVPRFDSTPEMPILPRMEVRLANTAEPAAYRSQLLPAFAAPSDCFFSIIR